MGFDALRIQALLVALASTLGSGTIRAQEVSTPSPTFNVTIPSGARVGTRKAGLVCLPSGFFKRSDFVSSDEVLKSAFSDAKNQMSSLEGISFDVSSLRLALTGIETKLCARRWAFGQTDAFSGTAKFTFRWLLEAAESDVDDVTETVTIEIRASKDEPLSPNEFLRSALGVLIGKIASQEVAD